MSNDCELIHTGPQPVVKIRTHTPVEGLPQSLGRAFAALEAYLGEIAEPPAGPPFVAYYNQDMQNLEIEIGFPVENPGAGRDDVLAGEIPAGRYAACLYSGPYYGLQSAYHALTAWVSEHGYQPSGVSYEYYLNDPDKTAPNDLQTRIVFPLV